MARYESISDWAKLRGISDSEYPYATGGLKVYQTIPHLLLATIIFAAARPLLFLLVRHILHTVTYPLIPVLGQIATTFLRAVAVVCSFIAVYAFWALAITTALIALVIYPVLIVLRWRSYERCVLRNDHHANKLRKRMLRTLNIRRRRRQLARQIAKAEGQSSGKSGEIIVLPQENIDTKKEAQTEALDALANMQVWINTRQSLTSDEVLTLYRIHIERPFIQETIDELDRLVKGLESAATRLEQGKVSFGSMMVSADQSYIEWTDTISEPDPYLQVGAHKVEHIKVKASFPLELFADRSDQIAEVKEKAKTWAENRGELMDKFMSTLATQGGQGAQGSRRLSVDVGNTNVAYTYELSFSIDFQRLDSYTGQIDQVFGVAGSTIELTGKSLMITLPLPEVLKVPIDEATMIRTIFGSDYDVWTKEEWNNYAKRC